jgi:hypothetical protein
MGLTAAKRAFLHRCRAREKDAAAAKAYTAAKKLKKNKKNY